MSQMKSAGGRSRGYADDDAADAGARSCGQSAAHERGLSDAQLDVAIRADARDRAVAAAVDVCVVCCDYEIPGGAQCTARNLHLAARGDTEVADGGQAGAGIAYAGTCIAYDDFYTSGSEAAERSDIDRQATGRGCAQALMLHPGCKSVEPVNRSVELGARLAGHQPRTSGSGRVIHRTGDADGFGDQFQGVERAAQTLCADVDTSAVRGEDHIALCSAVATIECVERHAAGRERKIAGVDEAGAVHGDAVGIGEDEMGAWTDDSDPTLQQGWIGAGDLVENQRCIDAGIDEIRAVPANVEVGIDVVAHAAGSRGYLYSLLA